MKRTLSVGAICGFVLFLTGCATVIPVQKFVTEEGKQIFCVEKERDGKVLSICKDERFSEDELKIIARSKCFESGEQVLCALPLRDPAMENMKRSMLNNLGNIRHFRPRIPARPPSNFKVSPHFRSLKIRPKFLK